MIQSNLSHLICKDRKIYHTQNYDIFKFSPKNRPHEDYKYLLESIRKNNLLHENPIKVDFDMKVLDGQHRLRSARELGVPIYFEYSSAKESDIPLLQVQKTWHLLDYAHFYRDEKEDYKYVDNIYKKYNLWHSYVISCCSRRTIGLTKIFKEGKFKLDYPKEYLDRKFSMLDDLRKAIQKVISKQVLKNGLQALWVLIDLEDYKHDRFLEKIEKYPSQVNSCMKLQMMSDIHNRLIMEVYNRNVKNEENRMKIPEVKIKLIN
jgi:hypothetical protein